MGLPTITCLSIFGLELEIAKLELTWIFKSVFVRRDNALEIAIICNFSHGQAERPPFRLCRSHSSLAFHDISVITTCPYWSGRDFHSSDKLQEMYVLALFGQLRTQLINRSQCKKACSSIPTTSPLMMAASSTRHLYSYHCSPSSRILRNILSSLDCSS